MWNMAARNHAAIGNPNSHWSRYLHGIAVFLNLFAGQLAAYGTSVLKVSTSMFVCASVMHTVIRRVIYTINEIFAITIGLHSYMLIV